MSERLTNLQEINLVNELKLKEINESKENLEAKNEIHDSDKNMLDNMMFTLSKNDEVSILNSMVEYLQKNDTNRYYQSFCDIIEKAVRR